MHMLRMNIQIWIAEQCRFEFVRFVRFETEQNRTRVLVFVATSEQNRIMPLFGSVQCGAELEQTEQALEMFCSVLFVQLAISVNIQQISIIHMDINMSPFSQSKIWI